MKQRIPLTSILLAAVAAVAFAVAFCLLVAPPEVEAQSPGPNRSAPALKTNLLPTTWTTVTAGVASNVLGFGNAGGYTAPAAVRLPYQQPFGIWVIGSCATVTLANAAIVLQTSPDSNVWANLPGGAGVFTVSSGASASSANNTNIVFGTNFTAAQVANANWIRVGGTTNGNAADLTSLRVMMTSP